MTNYFTTESLQQPCLRNLLLAPFLGLALLLFLPALGFYLTFKAIFEGGTKLYRYAHT